MICFFHLLLDYIGTVLKITFREWIMFHWVYVLNYSHGRYFDGLSIFLQKMTLQEIVQKSFLHHFLLSEN